MFVSCLCTMHGNGETNEMEIYWFYLSWWITHSLLCSLPSGAFAAPMLVVSVYLAAAIQTIHIVGIIQIRVLFPKSFWKNKIRVSLSILMHWQGNRERDPISQFPHEKCIKRAKLCTQILGCLTFYIYLAFFAWWRGQYVNIRQNQSNLFAPFGDKTLPLSYHHTTPLAQYTFQYALFELIWLCEWFFHPW